MAYRYFLEGDILYCKSSNKLFAYNYKWDNDTILRDPADFRVSSLAEKQYYESEFETSDSRFIEVNISFDRENIRELCQQYLGMQPADKGCANWSEMQDKMTDEIFGILKLKNSQS